MVGAQLRATLFLYFNPYNFLNFCLFRSLRVIYVVILNTINLFYDNFFWVAPLATKFLLKMFLEFNFT